MNEDKHILEQLEVRRTTAPDGFTERVMDALPPFRKKSKKRFWPNSGQWIAPAVSGAFAMLLIVFLIGNFQPQEPGPQVGFHFELHAPGADRVELLGTFNNWKTDDIVLVGPDASGHWTAKVELPEGRHEYIFLVDGERWMADPKAATHRPDGYGRVNTVINIYDENNV